MLKSWHTVITITVTISATFISLVANSLAQNITLDGSLGKKETLTGPNYEIHQSLGKTVGNNLFHSFGKFNLGTNESAIFHSTDNIHNILSRVTGSNPSSIDGLIRTLGKDVNLFLINPNGIIFGDNARLDVSGSFVASTADSFVFGDGIEFSATNPQAVPLLEIDLTPGLQYGKNHPSRTVKSTGNLTTGKDLKLFAGNLDLQGKLQAGRDLSLKADSIKVRDSVTNPFIAGAFNELSIIGKESIDIFALNHPNSGLFSGGDMMLASSNPVVGDIHFWSGGNFQIEKLDRSKGDLFSFYDPIIRSQGDVSFFAYQGASLHILAGGKVDINTAVITNPDTIGESINPTTTPNLANVTLSDGTSLIIDGSKKPTLDIRAGVDPAVIGNPLGTLGDSGIFFNSSIVPVTSPNNNPVVTSADITIGDIVILASNGTVLLTNQYKPNSSLQGGDITVNGDGVFGSGIDARGFQGDGSDVFLDSRSNINLIGSLTNPFSGINTSYINTSSNSGNAGNINLFAKETISMLDKLFIATHVFEEIVGNGGNIKIMASSVFADNGVQIVSGMFGEGNTGDIEITASDFISLDRNSVIGTLISPEGTGNAGNIKIKTASLSGSNGSGIATHSFGTGNSGNITIAAKDTVKFDGVSSNGFLSSSVQTLVGIGGLGKGGDIDITTTSLSLTNGGQIFASTDGIGNAGNVNIIAEDSVYFDGVGGRGLQGKGLISASFSDVGVSGIGNGGDINITTNSLSLTNGGQIVSSTFGKGDAGNLKINASEQVFFDGVGKTGFASSASARVNATAVGKGGNIEIVTKSLSITNGAQLTTDTRGEGDAGTISINAQEKVSFDGKAIGLVEGELREVFSGVFSDVSPGAIGNGNLITINTPLLLLKNDALISAATFGQGKAGSIKVTGNIFEATNAGQITTTTVGSFNAGNITLNIKDKITLSGSDTGIFANTTEGSSGKGGSIIIDPQTVTIKDGATIAVDSQGEGTGGDIQLSAGFLNLNNGTISAETRSNTGGNINLNLQDLLLLRNGSQISTTAGNQQFGGNGGNITINTPFIVALPQENSDITANAFSGNGGKINIQTNAIFGIFPRDTSTLFSDITASSQLGVNGEISIDAPDLDPSSGLVELPSNLVDTSQQITQGCSTRRSRKKVNSFTRIGRGGLPLSPNESLRGRSVITNWVDLPSQIANKRPNQREKQLSRVTVNGSQSSDRNRIIEAQDLVVDAKGDIFLVAKSTQSNVTPSGFSCGK